MSISWRLDQPIPAKYLKKTSVAGVGGEAFEPEVRGSSPDANIS